MVTAGSYKTSATPPPYGPAMDRLVALLGFGFVCTVTPGPNNILLWASGASFGLRRSWPHVLGTALGVGLMAVLVAAGLGVLVTTIPPLALAMKVAGSVYLLFLAWQVAGAGALEGTTSSRPMGLSRRSRSSSSTRRSGSSPSERSRPSDRRMCRSRSGVRSSCW